MSDIDWASLQKEAQDATLPDGDYNVICVEATMTNTQNGKPMIKAKFRVTEGPKKDRPIWSNFTVSAESPIALRIFFQQMAAFGLTADYFAKGPAPEQVARDLVNRTATLTLSTGEWQGNPRNQVDQVRPYQGSGPPPPGATVGPPVVGSPAGSPVGGPPVPSAPPVPATAGATSGPPVPTEPF